MRLACVRDVGSAFTCALARRDAACIPALMLCACVGERRCVMPKPTDLLVRCMWRSPILWLAERNDCPASLLQLFAVLGAIGMLGTRCDA